jgi:hypothetical protein
VDGCPWNPTTGCGRASPGCDNDLYGDPRLGCTDFAPDAEPEELSDASGVCTLSDGQDLSIAAFSSSDEVEAFVAFGEEAGCAFFAGQTVPFVVGDYWTISVNLEFEDLETDIPAQPTEDLADAVGAEVDTLDC